MFAVTRQFIDENGKTTLVHVVAEENTTTLTISDDTGVMSKNVWTDETAAVVLELLANVDENASG